MRRGTPGDAELSEGWKRKELDPENGNPGTIIAAGRRPVIHLFEKLQISDDRA
jgi:hypothetical protein